MVSKHNIHLFIVARWAQQLGLPLGNLWEPALLRYMEQEVKRLGGDASAYAFVGALTAHRLGMDM